jgi:Na+/H+-dicarboxylate symporter
MCILRLTASVREKRFCFSKRMPGSNGSRCRGDDGCAFGLGQQLLLMLTLMVTSKGVGAVPRASLIVLLAALQSFGLPLEGAAVIFAVDELLDMARTSVNVLGNCLASVVVARWEGEFDEAKALANFGSAAAAAKSEDTTG